MGKRCVVPRVECDFSENGNQAEGFFTAPVVAMSGTKVCPPLFDAMTIVGPDITRARLRHALLALGGVSKKQAKNLEKEFRSIKDSL